MSGTPDHDGDDAAPARPEIDPALLRSLETTEEHADVGPADPEDSAQAPDATGAVGDSVADDDEEDHAIAVGDLAPGAEEPPAEAEPDPVETDQERAALLALPMALRIEALLFAAAEPLPLPRLRELACADDPVAFRRDLDELAAGYDAQQRAFALTEVGGGFVLRTRPEVAPAVARLGKRRETERLSSAALETLAIVAYRQPVLRADVEKIRGVASGEVIRTLVERGLVRVAGRAEVPGSPLLYGTTQRFLELFGLRNLRDLPSDESLLRRE